MATRHTGGGEAEEDSDTDRSDCDRPEKGSEKGKRTVKQKILHSKAMRRVTGRKRGADVTPMKQLPPAHVQVPTARRTSDIVQQLPKEQQDYLFQYSYLPPPGGHHRRSDPHTQSPGATQQRRPDTSPQQTHAPPKSVLCEQPQLPSYSDPPLQSIAYDHLHQVM